MENVQLTWFYQSGMVLQRQTVAPITGIAQPHDEITIIFKQKEYKSAVSENGQWSLAIETGDASGPETLQILSSSGGKIVLSDIYVGEVWVLSGQSNMQLPLDRLKYKYPEAFQKKTNAHIRLLTVPIHAVFEERAAISAQKAKGMLDEGALSAEPWLKDAVWLPASPETLGSFSGTSYFFAEYLADTLNVPVGIINASQGGSPIASWLNERALASDEKLLKLLSDCRNELFVQQKTKSVQSSLDEWYKNCASCDEGIKNSWEKEFPLKAKRVKVPGIIPGTPRAGVIWLSKTITLTKEEVAAFAEKGALLWLGVIVDADSVWINGEKVGETPYMYPPRRYKASASLLHEGENTITIRVINAGVNEPFHFIEEKPYCLFTENILTDDWHLCLSDVIGNETPNNRMPLAPHSALIDLRGTWNMKVGCEVSARPPEHFWEWMPTALYNGMLSQLFSYAVRGFVWYQGESDTAQPEVYTRRLQSLMELWRSKFAQSAGVPQGKMPFITAQLPNFGEKRDFQLESGWALLREAQDAAMFSADSDSVNADTSANGLAVLIDSGEWNDLHPEDKQTVGQRLAFEALRIAYGVSTIPVSPRFLSAELHENDVTVRFSFDKSCLVNKESTLVEGFSVVYTGLFGKKCIRKAQASVSGVQSVQVQLPAGVTQKNILELRYLWADSPAAVTLYSSSGLPASPFRVFREALHNSKETV